MSTNINLSQCDTLPLEVEECLKDITKKEEYRQPKIYKRHLSTKGGNYLGDLFMIDIEEETKKGAKETNLFVKKRISSECIDDYFSIECAYKIENFFYTVLTPIFKELQDNASVPAEEKFKFVKSYSGPSSNVVILENLTKKGYKSGYRMDPVSLQCAELAVIQLATLHALGFVLKEKKTDYFDRNVKSIRNSWVFNDNWKKVAMSLVNNTIQNVNDDYKIKIERYVPTLFKKLPTINNVDENLVNGVCHGDFKYNNFLIKETNGEMHEVILIDYQFLRYGCPVDDLIFFICISTDRQFRTKHLDYIKNLYHDTLRKFLRYFNIDVDDVFSRKEFEFTFKKRLDFGLMIALFFFPLHFVKESDAPDLGTDHIESMNIVPDDRFHERIYGLINDFEEWGYI